MNSDMVFQGLAFFALIGAVGAGILVFQLKRRLNKFFAGSEAKDLESMLAELGKRVRENEDSFKNLRNDVARIDVMAEHALQKVGMLRYNPFGDVGSDQSFALALLDHMDNGVVLSSLYAREGTRVYAKSVVKGESKYHLSDEEKEVIQRAINDE